MNELETKWIELATKMLIGQTIKSVRYMTDEEMENALWSKRPLIIEFEGGGHIFATNDADGNDGGSLFTSSLDTPTIPAL